MTDYYVDWTGGNDSNAGTAEGTAWQTTSKVNTEWQAGTFSAGDNIYFKGGETWDIDNAAKFLHLYGSNGTVGNHIYLGSKDGYGTGRPVLRNNTGVLGNGAHIIYTSTFTTPDPPGPSSYFTIAGFEITSTNIAQNQGAIQFHETEHVLLSDLYVHGFTNGEAGRVNAITCLYSSKFITIEDCTITNIRGEGLKFGRDNLLSDDTSFITVRNCDVSYCDSEALEWKDGMSFITVYDSSFSYSGIGTDAGEAFDHFIVNIGGQHNHIYNCRIFGTRGDNRAGLYFGRYTEATDFSGRFTTVERCLFTDLSGDFGAVRMRGGDNVLLNCTIDNCNYGVYGQTSSTGSGSNEDGKVVKNCIFDTITLYPVLLEDTENNYTFDNNCYADGASNIWYYSGAARNYAYVSGTLGQETNGLTSDPAFVDTVDYELAAGSPCINAGDSSAVVWDWNNFYAGSGQVDIGWKEYDYTTHRVFQTTFTNLTNFSGSVGVTANNVLTVPIASGNYAYRTGLDNIHHFYTRFYINVDSLTMASGDEFTCLALLDGATNIVLVNVQYDGSNYRVRAGCIDDSNTVNYTSYYNLNGSGWSYVQLRWYAGQNTSKNNGFLFLYVNGVEEESIEGLNNHNFDADQIRIGTISGIDAGTSGTLWFDNLDVDWIRKLLPSSPNNPPPPTEVVTVVAVITVTTVVTLGCP